VEKVDADESWVVNVERGIKEEVAVESDIAG
jgi:hypothetical protein